MSVLSIPGKGVLRTSHGAILIPAHAATPAPTPTPTPTSPPATATGTSISFTGSAGAPTGNQVLTALPGCNLSGYALDGHGNAVLPSTNYQAGTFNAFGVVPDGFFYNATVAATTPEYGLSLVFRANAATNTYYQLTFIGARTILQQIVSGTATTVGLVDSVDVSGFSSVGIEVSGQTFTVYHNGSPSSIVFTDNSATAITADGLIGLGSSNEQGVLVSGLTITTLAEEAAIAAAAAQAVFLAGNPVAHPGADGFASGVYFKSTIHIATSCGSTPASLGSGFARGLSGPQSWTILDGTGTPINGLYFGMTGGGWCLYASGSFNFAQSGNVAATIKVTDGTTTVSKAVTLAFSANAVHVGCNLLLDTTAPNTGYPLGDPHRYLLNSGLVTNWAGGAVSMSEPSGLLVFDAGDPYFETATAAYPLTSHYGHITDAVLSVAASPAYTQAEEFWIAQEQPGGLSVATPAPLYDYWQVGDTLFQVSASSDAGVASYSVVASVDPVQISAFGAVVATGPLTAGTGKSITVRITSYNGVTTDLVHTYSVLAGTVLPATNITMAVAQNLDNQVLYQVVGTPAVTGMTGTPAWRIVQKEAHKAIFSNTILTQFTCDPATGKVTSTYMLPARSQGHTFTLIACDGPNVCRQTFTVPVAWWAGPTVYVGQGMVAAHGSGVGYEHFSDLLPRLCNNANWPDRTTGVATIIWAANSDPNYYANDCANGRGAFAYSDACRYGIQGSVRMIAADLNGPRVRIGGHIGTPNGGGDPGGKGFINKGTGDLYMEGFEVSWVLGDDAFHGISGVRYNADQYGDCTIIDCDFHDNDNGAELSCEVGIVTIDRTRSTNCGNNYVSSGATHGFYLEGIEVVVTNTHSYKHTNGHCLKIRSANFTVTGCVLGDGARGTCSEPLNIPEGGRGLVANNDFHKGPNAQNPSCIGYMEDDAPAEFDHDNILTVQNNRFNIICVAGSRDGNGVGVLYFPRISTLDGSKSQVILEGNQFFLYNSAVEFQLQPTSLTDPNPLPVSETGSTILTAPFALNMTDPRVGTGQTPGARPGFFVCSYDNETNYANMQNTQFDCGTEELRFPASTAAGTVLATIIPSGDLVFAIQNASDIRLNPFVAGTTWAIVQTSEYFPGQVWPLAGAFSLNPSSDGTSTQLLLGSGNSAGTQILKLEATAPNGTKSDWRYPITLTS